MLTHELDYVLPPGRIATEPAEPRDAARLMVIRRAEDRVEHRRVRDLPLIDGLLRPGDLLVFNQTKVLPALLAATRRATGGKVQGLYVGLTGSRWRVMLESRGTLRAGEFIDLSDDSHLELAERLGGGEWLAELHSPLATLPLLERIGATPLPPYIRHERKANHEPEVRPGDAERYNTVFAREPGSVAAPTAGLHFTPALLDALSQRGIQRASVTLHVGLGTFAPVRSERVEDHPIHHEFVAITRATLQALKETRARGGRIIPVGTTTVRALESLPALWQDLDGFTAETNLFITPGFQFRFADGLMTNFHLPRSTLLAMVASLPDVGIGRLKGWYQVAIAEGYRFYSYGDAMLIV
jgi:S-adenosylmethionine:tRNA ribosyltransferase-isomerase